MIEPSPLRAVNGAMLTVSRAMASGQTLPEVLDAIASGAARSAGGAVAATIMLIDRSDAPWRVAAAYGLREGYPAFVAQRQAAPGGWRTMAEQFVTPGSPIAIADTEDDPRFGPWRELARIDGYRSFLAVPLETEGVWIGSLNVFRPAPGPWTTEQIDLVSFFAEHATIAIRIRSMVERQDHEMVGLRRLVRALQEQGHERANRLHTVSGLLAIDAVDDAREFLLGLTEAHHAQSAAVLHRVSHAVLSGLLLAEASIAEQRSISFEVDPATEVASVPPTIGDGQLITIVGNLLDNAFDAVADLPAERRRVRVLAVSDPERLTVAVRDYGVGLPPASDDIFQRGVSTKGAERGFGLSIVRDAVHAARGTIEAHAEDTGTTFRVEVPVG